MMLFVYRSQMYVAPAPRHARMWIDQYFLFADRIPQSASPHPRRAGLDTLAQRVRLAEIPPDSDVTRVTDI